MIGLKQLASLLAGAIVLLSGAFVAPTEDGAVAIETTEGGATRALADEPVTLDLGEVQVYDLFTSRGAPTPPTTLDGAFETVRFVTATTDGQAEAQLGSEEVPISPASEVLVQGFSGTIDVQNAQEGVSLVLTGTAKEMQVEAPDQPRVETYAGSKASIPVSNVTLEGRDVSGAVEQGGSFDELEFTVLSPEGPGEDPPTLTRGSDTIPFEQTARLRVGDYAGVVAVIEVGPDQFRLRLDGFANVTVLGEDVNPRVHHETKRDVGVGGPNDAPEANFTYRPQSPEAQETIHFRSTSSDDVAIRGWDWSFGDGEASNGQNPEHQYVDDRTYRVQLTVTDALGRTDTKNKTVTVVNSRPVAQIEVDPAPPIEGQNVQLTANASDRDGDIVSYRWTIDGNQTRSSRVINHTFDEEGLYDVELVVTDEEGARGSATAQLDVQNAPPTPSFTVDPSHPKERETVFLQSTSSDYGDGQIVDHRWNIESVGSKSGEVAKVEFPDDGNLTVNLTVRDDDGDAASIARTVHVQNAAPNATIKMAPSLPNPSDVVKFRAIVDDADPIQDATWHFSDGHELDGLVVERTFNTGGTYTVDLHLTDDQGASATIRKTFTINQAPNLNLGPVNQEATNELAVQTNELFTVTARTDDIDGEVTGLTWSIDGQAPHETQHCLKAPDGNESRLQCAWPDDGKHLILANARDDNGATTTTRIEVLILNRAPDLNPSTQSGVVNAGETVTLTANAHDPDGDITELVWKLGDELIGVGQETNHRFDKAGNHSVTLVATDDDGAVSSQTFNVDVNAPPTAEILVDPSNPEAGKSVTFTAQADDPDGSDANLAYRWTLGDGTTASGRQVSHTYDVADTYPVSVTVTDEVGAEILRQINLEVEVPAWSADLSVSKTNAQVGEDLTFHLDVDDGREVKQIDWDFGDGSQTTTGENVYSVTHNYSSPRTYHVELDIQADHGDQRQMATNVRITGDEAFETVFHPQLPNGQCLNLSNETVDVTATNLATNRQIGLRSGDVPWSTVGTCTLAYTFEPGAWSYGDELSLQIQAGDAHESRTTTIERGFGSPDYVLEEDVVLRQAPIFLEETKIVSPDQESSSENGTTYRNPTEEVFLQGEAEWVEGTQVRDYSVLVTASYRGIDELDGLAIRYSDRSVHIDSQGVLSTEIPAPILGTDTEPSGGSVGPSLVYLPGQYKVTTTVSSGLYSDTQAESFIEDPAGIFAETDGE